MRFRVGVIAAAASVLLAAHLAAAAVGTADLTANASVLPTLLATASANATPTPAASGSTRPTARPNIILINLDDTRFDGIDRMPVTLEKLAKQGVQFRNAFVPLPACLASRASLLSGFYALHHQARALNGAIGGAHRFRETGADRQTIAVWLRDAGYATGLFGKYLNDYAQTEQHHGPGGSFYIPPGWTRWRAFMSPERYGGKHGLDYTLVDEHGGLHAYSDHATDAQYSTDVLGGEMRAFIADAAAAGQPFFAVYAPYASHTDNPDLEPVPAARHRDRFAKLPRWRPPSWNEADISDKPLWVHKIAVNDVVLEITDDARRRAYEALLSVDEQIAATLAQLETLGIADNTVVLLTSDNGVSWTEHRLFGQFKGCAYEECVRVPLLVRYPRGKAGGRKEPGVVLNIDIAPTIADLAGVAVPIAIDGRSFRAALEGRPLPAPRTDFLIERWRSTRADAFDYRGQPQDGDQLILLYGDPLAKPRAAARFEFDNNAQIEPGSIQVPIGGTDDVTFNNLALTVVANVPETRAVPSAKTKRLTIVDLSPSSAGVYWIEARDAAGVVEPLTDLPDFLGVRDVAGGFTYVEYETGERELYDLTKDPWQMQNVANTPAYAGEQARLSARVAELSAQ